MCILDAERASVNGGNHQLFDVVGVNSRGRFCLPIGNALPLDGATARAAGFNARPGDLTAVVVPSGTLVDILSLDDAGEVECVLNHDIELGTAQKLAEEYAEDDEVSLAPAGKETEAPTGPVDACSCADDSDATEGLKDATAGNLVADSRARFVQSAVRAHLEVIGRALPHVSDSGDIGLVAMSLRELAKSVDGIGLFGSIIEVPDGWGFDSAMEPEGWDNDALKAALGLECEVAA